MVLLNDLYITNRKHLKEKLLSFLFAGLLEIAKGGIFYEKYFDFVCSVTV